MLNDKMNKKVIECKICLQDLKKENKKLVDEMISEQNLIAILKV